MAQDSYMFLTQYYAFKRLQATWFLTFVAPLIILDFRFLNRGGAVSRWAVGRMWLSLIEEAKLMVLKMDLPRPEW